MENEIMNNAEVMEDAVEAATTGSRIGGKLAVGAIVAAGIAATVIFFKKRKAKKDQQKAEIESDDSECEIDSEESN